MSNSRKLVLLTLSIGHFIVPLIMFFKVILYSMSSYKELYSKGRYLISITKKDKPYIDIKEDGVTLFNPFETYASKEINFLWKEIEFIDIQIETLQRGYSIVFKVETNIPKKDAKLKQNWFLTNFNEMSNENVYFTTELLDLDQDWEDIILN